MSDKPEMNQAIHEIQQLQQENERLTQQRQEMHEAYRTLHDENERLKFDLDRWKVGHARLLTACEDLTAKLEAQTLELNGARVSAARIMEAMGIPANEHCADGDQFVLQVVGRHEELKAKLWSLKQR